MIRVLLADDHGVIRDGLGRLIGGLEDVELVGTAADPTGPGTRVEVELPA